METGKISSKRSIGSGAESQSKLRGAENYTLSKENVDADREKIGRPSSKRKGKRRSEKEVRKYTPRHKKLSKMDAFQSSEILTEQRGSHDVRDPPRRGTHVMQKYTPSKGKPNATAASEGRPDTIAPVTDTKHANCTLSTKSRQADHHKLSSKRRSEHSSEQHKRLTRKPTLRTPQAEDSESSYTLGHKQIDTESREESKRAETPKCFPSMEAWRTPKVSQAQNSETNYTLGNNKREAESRKLSKPRGGDASRIGTVKHFPNRDIIYTGKQEASKGPPSKHRSHRNNGASRQRRKGVNGNRDGNDTKENGEDENDEEQRGGRGRHDDDEEEEFLQMFLFADYMEREEAFQAALRDRQGVGSRHEMAPPYHHPHYSDQAKQKHEEVIRQILDDFDLEETKDKYRNSNACEFRREGTSLADFKFRSELMRLMGSEVIRISDTTWATRFQQKLREDYERKLEEKAHVLAEAEHERVHRLRLEGIMTGKASNRSEDLMKKAFTVNRMKSPLQRPVPQQSGTKTRKESVPKGSQPVFKDEQCNIRERELSARRTARTYQPPVTVHTVIEEVKKIEAEEEQSAKDTSSQEAGTTSTELEERKEPVEEEQTLTFSFGQLQKKKSATADERRLRLFKRLPPFVVKLYEAETVSSLYECAEQIVGSARAPKAPEVSDPEDAGFVRFMDSKAVHR